MVEAQHLCKIVHAVPLSSNNSQLIKTSLVQSFPGSPSAQVQLSGSLTFAPLAQLHTFGWSTVGTNHPTAVSCRLGSHLWRVSKNGVTPKMDGFC